ncbi:hypothetical protein CBER1_00105 [Cercospora berteroae]|uniref:Heterokaryon incompatibility domain-containing protein n=1 Tax=Cercospora berteroae TaxID=357750 RepID=A0A2S6CD70_9PEZI|nr:hypothetical protein CBER1_00105 [Cercospora berteroae]
MTATHEHDLSSRIRFRSSGFEQWYRLVELYSNTKLTRPEQDRIIALSGIAHEFREGLKASVVSERFLLGYTAGLWIDDIHHGLLWQSSSQDGNTCNCDAPSWSWATHVDGVTWLPRAARTTKHLEVISFTNALGSHVMSEMAPHRTVSDHEDPEDASTKDTIGKDLMSANGSLTIKGKLNWVYIDNNLEYPDHDGPGTRKVLDYTTVETLARETGVGLPEDYAEWNSNPLCQRAGDWRFICSISQQDIIGGWALFENSTAHLSNQLERYRGFTIRALHISTRHRIAPGGRSFSTKLYMYNDVYDVLFVEQLGEGVFRRVGIGRIMSKQIEREFDGVEEEILTLV